LSTKNLWAPPSPAHRVDGRGYRYPGSPPYADTGLDRLVFRGRALEADAVLHSILSSDLFVLYAISGTGKTSLLNAGVLVHLRERNMWPVVVRLNDPTQSVVDLISAQITLAADRAPDIAVMHQPGSDGTDDPSTLWDLLSCLEVWKGNTLQQPVLIFDQFEELFNLRWDDEARRQFIAEFGEIIRRRRNSNSDGSRSNVADLPPPSVRVVLVIREDSLGELDALAIDVPQIMQNRYRLLGLDPSNAMAAICEPAKIADTRLQTPTFAYEDAAAESIVDFLRSNKGGRNGVAATVDPSQLQIICQHIERTMVPGNSGTDVPGSPVIAVEDLGGEAGLNEMLRDFYRREIESFPDKERTPIRMLCETGLISSQSRRLSLEQGEIERAYGVAEALLDQLVGKRVLRSEPRVGSVYFELAHDTLVAPILAYRQQHPTAGRLTRLAAGFLKFLVEPAVYFLMLISVYGALNGVGVAVGLFPTNSLARTRSEGLGQIFTFLAVLAVSGFTVFSIRRARLKYLSA
jgi:hypothetical protein